MSDELSGEDRVLDLVGAIYDAALDASRWTDVLERIGDAVGGPEILFGVYDPASGLSNMLSPRIDPEIIQSMIHWAPRNPLLPATVGHPPGKVITCADVVDLEEFRTTPFFNEFWLPAGFDAEPLTTNLLAENGATGILTSFGSIHRRPFDSEQKLLFATLAQHLVRAVALQRRVHHLTISQHSALAGLDQLHQGVVLVDAQARPAFINIIAGTLIDARDALLLEAGVLSALNADDARDLRALIASCSAEDPTRLGGEMMLRRPPGRLPLQVLVTPLRQGLEIAAMPWATGRQPSATVLITDPEAEMRSRIETLRERFGLTRAEATFALEIVKGDGRKATADRLGITVGTARSHLSKIFDKTGVSRQAELVRLLLQR